MRIIICGAGQVGWHIARHLAAERNDVTVIDTSAELIRRATDALDVQGVTGFASHPDVLDRGGREGHWGLAGMRERAARIGARLDIASGPGEGTRVEVQVPAAVAYRPRTAWWRRRMGRHRA